jgi:transcriptional regulator with XRE-family HTH domain
MMGKLYDLIQEHIDSQAPYEPSGRQVAKQLGVSQTTMNNWRTPKRLIEKKHLEAIARVTRNPYGRVLDALLQDIDYASPGPDPERHQSGTSA